MAQNSSHEVETIVNALLQVSDRVVEVSKYHVITKIWDSYLSTLGSSYQYIGKQIIDLANENIVKQCDDLVAKSFALRDNNFIQYTTSGGHSTSTYSIRILAIHPDKDFLFVVIKNLSTKEGIEMVEDKWRLALDAAGDGMWDLNMQTGKIFFSPKWHDIFGYNSSEISSWDTWASKIHPEDHPKYKKKVEDYVAGLTSSYSVEQRFLCKDGTYKWILSRGVIISKTSDGKPLRAIGTHHDINDKKIAEEALKTSRETFASAFDHSGIGIALIGPDGKWVDVNGVICEMTGYPKEELMKLTHYDVTYPADRDIDRGLIDQMLDKDIYTYSIEKRYLSKDKKIVMGLLTVSLVWNSDNTPKFFITQVIDITKKKELENQIKRKNAELEAARASLLKKVNQLEELNHVIANNLKGPADKIKSLSDGLLHKNKTGKMGSAGVPNDNLTEDEALHIISENSESLIDVLSALMVDVEEEKG